MINSARKKVESMEASTESCRPGRSLTHPMRSRGCTCVCVCIYVYMCVRAGMCTHAPLPWGWKTDLALKGPTTVMVRCHLERTVGEGN